MATDMASVVTSKPANDGHPKTGQRSARRTGSFSAGQQPLGKDFFVRQHSSGRIARKAAGRSQAKLLKSTSAAGIHKGAQPSCGGSRSHGAGQRSWLAGHVPCGVGGTRPPRLSPGGGNGKGGDPTSLLPRAELGSSTAPAIPARQRRSGPSSYANCVDRISGRDRGAEAGRAWNRPRRYRPAVFPSLLLDGSKSTMYSRARSAG